MAAPKFADRVRESSTTTGTGTLTLSAVAGFQRFTAAIGSGNVCSYAITDGVDWETGEGTVGTNTLARTTVKTSSNGNAAVNWTGLTLDVFVDMTALEARRLPLGHIHGMRIRYAAAGQIKVEPGVARGALNDGDIRLLSEVTVDLASTGANGLNKKTLTETMATTNTSTAATASADIYSSLSGRTLTGTFTTSGTALTGTGSLLLAEVKPGDVVRVAGFGAARIASVETNLGATLVAALPDGPATGTPAGTCFEFLAFKIASQTVTLVDTIANNGTAIVLTTAASVTASGQAIVLGPETPSARLFVFVAVISGTVCAFIDTRRTTPTPNANLGAYRYIGYLKNDASSDLRRFKKTGSGVTRTHTWNESNADLTVASATGPTTLTPLDLSAWLSPFALRALLQLQISGPNAGTNISVRERNWDGPAGAVGMSAPYVNCPSGGDVSIYASFPCDAQGYIEYINNVSGNNRDFIYCAGFEEDLGVSFFE